MTPRCCTRHLAAHLSLRAVVTSNPSFRHVAQASLTLMMWQSTVAARQVHGLHLLPTDSCRDFTALLSPVLPPLPFPTDYVQLVLFDVNEEQSLTFAQRSTHLEVWRRRWRRAVVYECLWFLECHAVPPGYKQPQHPMPVAFCWHIAPSDNQAV